MEQPPIPEPVQPEGDEQALNKQTKELYKYYQVEGVLEPIEEKPVPTDIRENRLFFVGRVGTGFSDKLLKDICLRIFIFAFDVGFRFFADFELVIRQAPGKYDTLSYLT